MWLWTQEEYGGDYFGDLPEGGYASVVGALGTGLDVRQEWPAVRVELTGGGVTVTSASGETEAGSHVVVTVPLGAQERPAGLRATPSARASRGRTPTRLRPLREGCPEVRRAVLA